jgi:hypothetical protein
MHKDRITFYFINKQHASVNEKMLFVHERAEVCDKVCDRDMHDAAHARITSCFFWCKVKLSHNQGHLGFVPSSHDYDIGCAALQCRGIALLEASHLHSSIAFLTKNDLTPKTWPSVALVSMEDADRGKAVAIQIRSSIHFTWSRCTNDGGASDLGHHDSLARMFPKGGSRPWPDAGAGEAL